MKEKQHQYYSIKITEDLREWAVFTPRTAVIIFRDGNRNVVKKERYGVLESDEIYKKIIAKEEIDISNCYVKNFSLSDCRIKHELSRDEKLTLTTSSPSEHSLKQMTPQTFLMRNLMEAAILLTHLRKW